MFAKTLLLFVTIFVACKSFCQDAAVFKPDSIKKELHATAIMGSLHIDGILNEPEWETAPASPALPR